MHNNLPEISTKNTKNEILEAYTSLLSKLQDMKQGDPQLIKKQQEEKEILKKASDVQSDTIVKTLNVLKISIGQELNTIEQKINDEHKKLSTLQEAIALEAKNLEELYGIKKHAESVAALILAHKEYKSNFEREKELLTQEQQREQEEYNYQLKIERKKDKDAYEEHRKKLERELEERKKSFEKEIAEREAFLKSNEENFKELQEKVSDFPQELEQAIKTAEHSTKETIESYYKHKIEIFSKEFDYEKKLNQQIIHSLQEKIKEQETYIQQLTQKSSEATKQVQSIAMKALEGASFRVPNFEKSTSSNQQ